MSLPPTERATAADDVLESARAEFPVRPPNVAAVRPPKESPPAPPANVLLPRAWALPRSRLPAETVVLPENVLAAESVTVPVPDLMIPPTPAIVDCTTISPPTSSSVEVEATWIEPVSVRVPPP